VETILEKPVDVCRLRETIQEALHHVGSSEVGLADCGETEE
jgi:hypothetical protein